MTHDRPGEIIPDGHAGAIVMLDGQPQSHVNVTDPTDLGFEYVELMATALCNHVGGSLSPTVRRTSNSGRTQCTQMAGVPSLVKGRFAPGRRGPGRAW